MRFVSSSPRQLFAISFTSIIAAALLTTGCGSGGSASTPQFSGNTQVTVALTSTANDQLTRFNFGFSSITLTNQSGTAVPLLSEPQNSFDQAELIHANGKLDPLVTATIPQGIYTAATVQILGGSLFECVTFAPPNSQEAGSLYSSEWAYGYVPNNMVSVTLSSPVTVTGTSMGLLVDLNVAESATYPGCGPDFNDGPFSITPTFNLTPLLISSGPTNAQNGKVAGLNGEVTAIGTGNSLTLTLAEGPRTLSISADSSTVYQGVSGFSALTVGTFVNMDGAIQPDGSLLATRVAVEDPSAADVLIGPVMQVTPSQPVGNEPAALFVNQQSQGKDEIGDAPPYSISNSTFQISGELNNVQSLPFVATFNGANMVAGQNVYVTSASISLTGGVPWVPATTITLLPQTINATILGSSTVGNFTDYTVVLASYDLFPTLAMQTGQTTELTNPSQVDVYVDNNTQMLNSQPIAAGNNFRFYGLVFNDNGALRMDCAQVNDGVAFNPPQNSAAQAETAKVTVRPALQAGVQQTVTVSHTR
ncbi:MAG: DUF5666 domain-containing protein [Candidatus Sulfotelmatobacter sp.]|jgi:hypothetical protein